MADYTEFLQVMKRAAVEAVAAGKPAAFCYGTVMAVEPLQIMAEQKLLLEAEQLELTSAVQDILVDVEICTHTENNIFNLRRKNKINKRVKKPVFMRICGGMAPGCEECLAA